jgi:hypothetical protein
VTEDELLSGVLDAFRLSGWRYWHARRSDHALWQGNRGWPDVTALPPRDRGPLLVLELKGENGSLTPEQGTWLARLHRAGITTAVVRPARYDRALGLILAGDSSRDAWEWAFRL